jgi:hypothetical protein
VKKSQAMIEACGVPKLGSAARTVRFAGGTGFWHSRARKPEFFWSRRRTSLGCSLSTRRRGLAYAGVSAHRHGCPKSVRRARSRGARGWGWRDEGTTECYALQAGVEIGQRLGLSEDTARQMMRQQLVENALRSRARPAYLVPPDCRDGGRLDLKPDVARFP